MNKGTISHNQKAYESKLALSRLALLKALRAWLQEEQRAAQHNLTQCRAACDAEDALYWARRHAQLAITANVVDWFTEAAAL